MHALRPLPCSTTSIFKDVDGHCLVLSSQRSHVRRIRQAELKDHKRIVVLDSPGSFESELAALQGVEIIRDLKKAKQLTFSLAFVTTQEQVNTLAPAIARKTEGDAIVWFAYPKGTSKKYKSQIDRDHGWTALGQEGFEPVRTAVRELKSRNTSH